MEDSLLRQSFRFRLALSSDILKSKITLVVKKLLEFSKKKNTLPNSNQTKKQKFI